MKQVYHTMLFLSLMMVGFTDCTKDSKDFEGLRVKIDDRLWTASNVNALSQSGQIEITGTDPKTFEYVTILLPDGISAGTYSITVSSEEVVVYGPTALSFLFADTGTIVITEHDVANKKIKGTFEFDVRDTGSGKTYHLKDGEFNVQYQ